MTDLLGLSTPLLAYRRDLTALRATIKSVGVGDEVTARFRAPGHGVFEVSGQVWSGVADDGLKVGWWDLTSGASGKPTDELQTLSAATPGAALPAQDQDDLREELLSLTAGDVVTAAFDFPGSGPFTLRGGVKINDAGTAWMIATIYISKTTGEPAATLQTIAIDQKASPVEEKDSGDQAAIGAYDLFGD